MVGAMGPLGIRIEPWGPTATHEAEAHFRRQAEGLLEGGVDGFILETFSDLHELEAAYRVVRSVSDLPVLAQVTVGGDGITSYGTDPAQLGEPVREVIGLVSCEGGSGGLCGSGIFGFGGFFAAQLGEPVREITVTFYTLDGNCLLPHIS